MGRGVTAARRTLNPEGPGSNPGVPAALESATLGSAARCPQPLHEAARPMPSTEPPRDRSRTVVILAAGEGKRMKSALPKVLHPLLGRTLVGHVLAAAAPARRRPHARRRRPRRRRRSTAHLAEIAPGGRPPVLQAEQHGTGHAVRIALDAAPDATGTVVVLNGDVPLLRAETVERAGRGARGDRRRGDRAGRRGGRPDRARAGSSATADGGAGADRRGARRDADAQRAIREINAGIYAFDAALLRAALGKLSTDNDQGEEYLTDVFGAARRRRRAGRGARAARRRPRRWAATTGRSWPALRALLRDRVNARPGCAPGSRSSTRRRPGST